MNIHRFKPLIAAAIVSLTLSAALTPSTVWSGLALSRVPQGAQAAGKPPMTKAPPAVQDVATAHALIRYAERHQDPHAFIMAARMLREAGLSPARAALSAGEAAAPKGQADRRAVDALLRRAIEISGRRADVVAAADAVAQTGQRGRLEGPKRVTAVVGSGKEHRYTLSFKGGETAGVVVAGDGDSDLDLYVYDEAGNLVCEDEGDSDDMLCAWTPRQTTRFVVVIKNLGVANEYDMVTN